MKTLFGQCFVGLLIAIVIAALIFNSAEYLIDKVHSSGNYTRLGEFTNDYKNSKL